jgi:hypothetical protein
MHPLVLGQLRYSPLQAALNAVGVSFEVRALLMLAGISDHWLGYGFGDVVVCTRC